jgi:mRNA interferase MazF
MNGTARKMQFMIPYDIILVPFPFADLSSTKQRPCLVLCHIKPERLPEHLIVSMITSQVEGLRFPYDLVINKWKESGLPKPSLLRLSKIVTIEKQLVRKKIGSMQKSDRTETAKHLKSMFDSVTSNK